MSWAFWLIGAGTTYLRWRSRRTIVVCERCNKDHAVGTGFCSECGPSILLPAEDHEKLQDAKFQIEKAELEEKARGNAAIKRIQALRKATACGNPKCN